MKNISNTEFVQISTRLRASLGSLSHADRIQKAIDAATSQSALTAAMRSIMMQDAVCPEGASLDEMCDAYMSYAVNAVRSGSPEPGLYDSLLYKFDAANIKLALKCSLRGESTPSLFPYATVSTDAILRAAEERDFSALPSGIAAGCTEAVTSYAETGDAMSVDLLIDRGCFSDIADAAAQSGISLMCDLASFDADAANATAFARIAALPLTSEAKHALFSRAFVPGGRIAEASFPRSEMSFDELIASLGATHIGASLRAAAEEGDVVSALEAALRNQRAAMCDKVRFVPFGGEVPAAYLVERESEVRAFALCAAYLRRGASQGEIRERLK